MVNDFTDADQGQPSFFFHLGDVIYSFGEAKYYYDQFYEPYRDYPAPIIALAGNHDGMVAPGSGATTLAVFLENFCAGDFEVTAEAGGLSRTAQIQPGVFFTFEAPFVRILALYTNTLEDPGVISNSTIGNSQLTYLNAALTRAKSENSGRLRRAGCDSQWLQSRTAVELFSVLCAGSAGKRNSQTKKGNLSR